MSTQLAPHDQAELLHALTVEIRALRGRAAGNVYQMGAKLARIHRDALWSAAYESFEDYLERAVDMSRTTAYRAMKVATHFNAEIAERYGIDKVSAALRWMELTPLEEQPGDLFAAQIRVRGPDGRFLTLPLHEATAVQIREAVSLLADSKRGGTGVGSSLQQRAARLDELLAKGKKRSGRVKLSRARDGRVMATFKAVPLDDLGDFVAALGEFLASDEDA